MKPDDIAWIFDDWSNWMMNRPREIGTDVYLGTIMVDDGFGSKPPPHVWMTPAWQLRDYQAMKAAYERLPTAKNDPHKEGDFHMAIRIYYLWEIKPPSLAICTRALGLSYHVQFKRLLDKARHEIIDAAMPRKVAIQEPTKIPYSTVLTACSM